MVPLALASTASTASMASIAKGGRAAEWGILSVFAANFAANFVESFPSTLVATLTLPLCGFSLFRLMGELPAPPFRCAFFFFFPFRGERHEGEGGFGKLDREQWKREKKKKKKKKKQNSNRHYTTSHCHRQMDSPVCQSETEGRWLSSSAFIRFAKRNWRRFILRARIHLMREVLPVGSMLQKSVHGCVTASLRCRFPTVPLPCDPLPYGAAPPQRCGARRLTSSSHFWYDQAVSRAWFFLGGSVSPVRRAE